MNAASKTSDRALRGQDRMPEMKVELLLLGESSGNANGGRRMMGEASDPFVPLGWGGRGPDGREGVSRGD